jgi:DNA-binding SARP family transcriptional activator
VSMRALYAAGRPAEALERYAVLRRRLDEELGTDPSTELQSVYQATLRGDLTVPGIAPAAAPTVTPAQLPADVAGFAGRAEQLARLDALLAPAAGPTPRAAVISAVSGTAGVGKTNMQKPYP